MTAIDNERLHSQWRIVMSRLREAATPENAEYWVLARHWASAMPTTAPLDGIVESEKSLPTLFDDDQ